MSEEQTGEKQNDIEANADAEFEVEDRVGGDTAKRGNALAWLAIVLSILAVTAVGYSLFLDWRNTDDSSDSETLAAIEALNHRLGNVDETLTTLEQQIAGIEHPDYSDDFAAISQDVEERIRLLNSLPSRMTSIEATVASLAGISAGARETFLLAEGEYYLQIANAQLQLANNPHLAALALGMADERITQLSDPALTEVRRAISDEMAALEVMEKPDLEGATLTLASLARVVESIPLRGAESADDNAGNERDPEAGTLKRAWGSIKDAMSGLVKVTPPEQAKLELVSPDAEDFLRNNIALQLQSARLALLRGEQAIFEQTLDDVSELLDAHFDTSSEQVISTQKTLSEIRGNVFTRALPDISGSLRLLRQYRTLRESSE
ncbi:MAG TPA: uroporphyrinogen-III C-methyltransferase [Woeseiaceae bacterium]|nr:uroporphyrinogen-III C-methyltransferase [Woeseiaceae bacterium]